MKSLLKGITISRIITTGANWYISASIGAKMHEVLTLTYEGEIGSAVSAKLNVKVNVHCLLVLSPFRHRWWISLLSQFHSFLTFCPIINLSHHATHNRLRTTNTQLTIVCLSFWTAGSRNRVRWLSTEISCWIKWVSNTRAISEAAHAHLAADGNIIASNGRPMHLPLTRP